MKLSAKSTVLIQGITGQVGQVQAKLMKSYGTRVVAGVSPGRGGTFVFDIPVFDLVEQAIAKCGPIDMSVLFVPPYAVLDAALEAIAAGIRQLVIITVGVPPLDVVRLLQVAEQQEVEILGPNSAGVIVPGEMLVGVHPSEMFSPGTVALLSRCDTLAYEVARILTKAEIGQSMCVGLGSDAIVGSSLIHWLQILDEHEGTEAILLVEDISRALEREVADYMRFSIEKPAMVYLAGQSLPPQHWPLTVTNVRQRASQQWQANPTFPHPTIRALQEAEVPCLFDLQEIVPTLRPMWKG